MESGVLFSTSHWNVIFADEQAYFGRLVIVSKADRSELPQLSRNEREDFFDLIKKLEEIYKKEFSATMFNYSCLMNHAYRDKKKPRVHWHFRPRYEKAVTINGHLLRDPNFGKHYVPDSIMELTDATPKAVREYMASTIKKHFV